ncbi:MAG TPA: N-6 DNA methylase, partial [Ktedonobacterales bacterium]|nr:N-6 DNA methylase [Ktedonobacterales bacterium]
MSALKEYLEDLHRIRASGIATIERSYYPALDGLFRAVGDGLTPLVAPIHDIQDQGAGHPDFVLEVEDSHDLRAAVEVKGLADDVEEIVRSEQVRRYLTQHDPVLVTNLRDFALTRRGANGHPEIFMRHTLAPDAATFWRTPVHTLVAKHEHDMLDLLTNTLLWDARLTRPRDLARALARYARNALRRLETQDASALAPLRSALADALGLHFTDEHGEHFFRSSLVQTLFYGLFSAWVVWNRQGAPGGEAAFRWKDAGDYLSLPVLRELFESVARPGQLLDLDLSQPLEWAEATLRHASWAGFSAGFDESDAVNYFYEPFLEAYDPDLRDQLGVWYTPREIIRYQVARVDQLLREELGKPLGLADSDVLVLDPATGTGGYPLEVLRVIDATLRKQGVGATRAMQLRRAATRRVFGFEILPAPFVVAHLQLATLLASLGAPLEPNERAGVYLTNALTGWKQADAEQGHFAGFPKLKGEVEAATEVKRSASILVVLGNPPYNGFAGVAEAEEGELIKPYMDGLYERFGIQARWLNDLYVRFFRL